LKTKRKSRFLTVGQAAEVLSVAANTVRAWGAAGKLTEYRHPINNYRLYKLADIEKLQLRIENSLRSLRGGRTRKAK